MTEHLGLRPHSVRREDRDDGSILLHSGYDLGPVDRSTGVWLDRWANATPDALFLAERSGTGWRTLSYGEARAQVHALAAGLLARGLDGPIMILSGNSIDHALLALATQYVGLVSVPVAEQYSLIPAAHGRLKYIADLVKPALVYAADGDTYAAALKLLDCPATCSNVGSSGAIPFDVLQQGRADVRAAHLSVGPDTIAKLLLTSGSTSDPKAVETTQRMMTTNQAQLRDVFPFLEARPPVMVDWLPWNHVFGGSLTFNLVLSNGGAMYIDDGKPLPALFPRTVENLGLVSATVSFNVPVGFAQLVQALEESDALCQSYFKDLDMIFYAGASLPQDTWTRLERVALKTGGRMPLITSGWGLTETAPGALVQHEPAKGAGIIGAPLPGVVTKLLDDGTGRMETRVKGPSIFERYYGNAEKTADAFDQEGFFKTGDAMRFVDPEDMDRGLQFDGRTSEDFKLSTGTWVHAAQIRLEMIACLGPYAQDVIVCGHGRDEVGILIVPGPKAQAGQTDAGALLSDAVQDIRERVHDISSVTTGSARRVVRALVLADPPDIGAGEMTAKGNINFARLLERRSHLVERLYDDDDAASILT